MGSSARSKARSNARSSAGVTDRVATGVRDRVAPTDPDLAVARSRVEETRRRISEGESVSGISQTYHVPVRAVELSLAEPGVQPGVLASAPPGVPPGAAASPSKPAAVPESPSALAELLGGASERGTYTETMKLMRETASTDLLSSFLQEQLEEKRLANRQHRLEIERLERGGATPGRGDGDGGTVAILLPNGQLIHAAARDADAVRASFSRGEREDRVAVLEHELQVERDKGRESRMESLLRDMDRRHAEELRGLEGRLARHKTQDDIELDGLARSTGLKYDTQSRLLSEGAERVKDAPHLGRKLEKVVDLAIASPGFQEKVRRISNEWSGEVPGEVVEQSPEHMAQALAELQGLAAVGQATAAERRPTRLIPAWRPPDEPSTAPAESHDPEASGRAGVE